MPSSVVRALWRTRASSHSGCLISLYSILSYSIFHFIVCPAPIIFRMFEGDHSRYYLTLAFAAGILLTLGYKDLYPDLERRYQQRLRRARTPLPPRAPGAPDHVSLVDASKDSNREKQGVSTTSTAQQPILSSPYEIKTGIEGTIGNTPLIKIKSLSEATGCEILAKAEFLNGAGNSPKDRVAASIITLAEEEGLLTPNSGDVIYEGTVGSTGISLAAICRARGYLAHMYVGSRLAPILPS